MSFEEAAVGRAIIDSLGRQVQGVIGVTPGRDETGARGPPSPSSTRVTSGCQIRGRMDTQYPERAWVDDFLHQSAVFPQGAHDDDVDAFTQLISVRSFTPIVYDFCTW